ncbi:hypothetical protein GE061_005580 [Apolygus lucorum]|uniref:Uncharacterized protein n=1 Tax=Apolygus lucorum TaxID=248454 RepID=A0A8S9WWR3_APOLU|nr:hypothetical protein GE061_005580 [Apolygus lucorum]
MVLVRIICPFWENKAATDEVFTLLDSEDAESIARAKEALTASELETQLHYIDSNFRALPDKIELLQRQNTLLIEAVETVEEFG